MISLRHMRKRIVTQSSSTDFCSVNSEWKHRWVMSRIIKVWNHNFVADQNALSYRQRLKGLHLAS
jgi:hypothetical protein